MIISVLKSQHFSEWLIHTYIYISVFIICFFFASFFFRSRKHGTLWSLIIAKLILSRSISSDEVKPYYKRKERYSSTLLFTIVIGYFGHLWLANSVVNQENKVWEARKLSEAKWGLKTDRCEWVWVGVMVVSRDRVSLCRPGSLGTLHRPGYVLSAEINRFFLSFFFGWSISNLTLHKVLWLFQKKNIL